MDKNNKLAYELMLSLLKDSKQIEKLCINNPKKCSKDKKIFLEKILLSYGYKTKKTDNLATIYKNLLNLKSSIGSLDISPTKQFTQEILEDGNDILLDILLGSGLSSRQSIDKRKNSLKKKKFFSLNDLNEKSTRKIVT